MKAVKLSDETHAKLTGEVGRLTAKSGKMQTYEDAIIALFQRMAPLPPELAEKIEQIITKHKELGYITKEDFILDAIRIRIQQIHKQEQPEKGNNAK